MLDVERIILKFNALFEQADSLENELVTGLDGKTGWDASGAGRYLKFTTSAKHLLRTITLKRNTYSEEFEALIQNDSVHKPSMTRPTIIKGILEAAKEDFEGGLLADTRLLISAEIFADFLEQSNHFLDLGYKDGAAVIIGAVLEDGLRKIAVANNVEFQSDTAMEALSRFLLKADVYNELVHKEILAKAQIRNDAAHGKFDQYGIEDVKGFHAFVQRFLAEYMK